MKISIILKDTSENLVDGLIQVDKGIKPTENGMNYFNVEKGTHFIRGLADRFFIEQKTIIVENEDVEVTLLATRG